MPTRILDLSDRFVDHVLTDLLFGQYAEYKISWRDGSGSCIATIALWPEPECHPATRPEIATAVEAHARRERDSLFSYRFAEPGSVGLIFEDDELAVEHLKVHQFGSSYVVHEKNTGLRCIARAICCGDGLMSPGTPELSERASEAITSHARLATAESVRLFEERVPGYEELNDAIDAGDEVRAAELSAKYPAAALWVETEEILSEPTQCRPEHDKAKACQERLLYGLPPEEARKSLR